tara:strand:- start:290 stop:1066 length:777 start_codon:yes stop_codon:yes gene_type:complete
MILVLLLTSYITFTNCKEYLIISTRDIIPKILHKTGPRPKYLLDNEIKRIFKKTLDLNPGFILRYYDDSECLKFIKRNFEKSVVDAYERLIPGAYKADLFRYCVLYIEGGVYSDLTQTFYVPFDRIIDFDVDSLVLVDDFKASRCSVNGIQINFMAAIPRMKIFKDAINAIVLNVNSNYYGSCSLEPTGPCLFRRIYDKSNVKAKIILKQKVSPARVEFLNGVVAYKNKMTAHDKSINKTKSNSYSTLWNQRKIYKNI